MPDIISVRFRSEGKQYYFDPQGETCRVGDGVIVETAAGKEYAVCVRGNFTLPEEELALLVDFCQCELFGQVTNWLNQNMVYDIVAHVQALCRLFEGSIAQALEAAPMDA